jgi:cytochrome c biogenesis protein CcmG/thiol:disulfide interchange protein DsbE
VTARPARLAALATAVVVLGLLVVLVRAAPDSGPTASTTLLDQPAPAAVGTAQDGSTFELARRRGSWVVLNFFTSTCIPCQREHPELVAFAADQERLGSLGAELHTIVQHDDRDAVERFFAENGGDWPIVFDDAFNFQNSFGVAQVPETWIIDPAGIVRARAIGEVTAEFLSTTIQRLRQGA